MSQTKAYKHWNDQKVLVEDEVVKELKEAFISNKLGKFQVDLTYGKEKLVKIYDEIPDSNERTAEEHFLSNHKLRELFALMCQTDGSGEFIKEFLKKVPVFNEDIKYTKINLEDQASAEQPESVQKSSPPKKIKKPLLIAIQANALKNVETLLSIDSIDVNVVDRSTKKSALVMIFELLSRENYEIVEKLVEKFAELDADINLGYFQTHPLSVLCKKSLDLEYKKKILKLCLIKFDCDVKNLYEGKTLKDIEEVGIPAEDIRDVPAQANYLLLKTFLTAGNEKEFKEKFVLFYENIEKNQTLEKVYKLLQCATSKKLYESMKLIFKYLKNDERYSTDDQIKLSKQLKPICKIGDPIILEMYLSNIKSPIENKNNEIMLTCVKELHKSITADKMSCFQMVLNDRRISAEKCDLQKETALHFAVQRGMDDEARSIMTRRAPYLGSLNAKSETPLHTMKFEVLEFFLKSRVSTPKNKNEIHLDLKGLIPPRVIKPKKCQQKDWDESRAILLSQDTDDNSQPDFPYEEKPEIDVFYLITESEKLKPLLRHPVISLCLRIKWLFLRWIVYAISLLNLLFTISFSVYSQLNTERMKNICVFFLVYYCIFSLAILFFDQNIIKFYDWLSQCWNQTQPSSEKQSFPSKSSQPSPNTLPETPKPKWKPLQSPEWMDLFYLLYRLLSPTIIFLSYLSLTHRDNATLSMLILLSGIDNIIHFKLLPSTTLSSSIIMLETVSRSLLKILLCYLILLLTFGLSFHVLFSNFDEASQSNDTNKNSFDEFPTMEGSLLKSLVMMIGELNAQDIPFYRNHLSYLTFIFFLFLVTLVIMNLANGLAVSDVTELRKNAELDTLTSWVKMLYRFEHVFSSYFPSAKWYTSLCNSYEPKIIIKTDEGNMIKLLKLIKRPDDSSKYHKTETTNNDERTREVCVQIISEDHEQTGNQRKTKSSDKSDKTQESVPEASHKEDCLRVFPALNYCHSVNTELCRTLMEIGAENLINEETAEHKMASEMQFGRKHSFDCDWWDKLAEKIKNRKFPEICRALVEIGAENLMSDEALEYKLATRINSDKAARDRWNKLMVDIKKHQLSTCSSDSK